MPELPEVETVRRTLGPRVEGRRIADVRFLSPIVADRNPDALAARLTGRTIARLSRIGKHLLFELDDGVLDVHLRMTGKFLIDSPPGVHTRAVIELNDGLLLFDDVRQFGRMRWLASLQHLQNVGPDALELDEPEFRALLQTRRGRIKPLLLNQAFISGLGNIYVDEALFRAHIHPLAVAMRIGAGRAARLYAAIIDVLTESLAAGGSSISDYVDATGARGAFQRQHRVYGRAGEPCSACGTPIRRMMVGQRGTHFCPRCQKT